jgi:hypothetical protein
MSNAADPKPPPGMPNIAGLGLAAAAAVVERFLEAGRRLTALHVRTAGPAVNPRAPDEQERARRRKVRALREQADRLIDHLGQSLHQILDSADLIEELAEAGAQEVLSLGPVAPGQTETAEFWLHVLDGPASTPTTLHASALTAHDGQSIPSTRVTFDPPTVDLATLRAGHAIRVTIQAPPQLGRGVYYGHLLATGLPETCLPIRVTVSDQEKK